MTDDTIRLGPWQAGVDDDLAEKTTPERRPDLAEPRVVPATGTPGDPLADGSLAGGSLAGGSLADGSLDLPEELPPGTMIGEYRLVARIAEGGMGVVYVAAHPIIGKRAAVKVMTRRHSVQVEAVERFVAEARAANRIDHPNIVDVFSFGTLPDLRAYMVMEWIDGETLAERLTRGPLSLADTCVILDGIIAALRAAHDKGVIHRDLKPDNVFVLAGLRVKLFDFGIAKLTSSARPARRMRTRSGSLIGTPRYISPEQARGHKVDGRTDIYSLGVMAFEMLSGEAPFEADNAMDLVFLHLNSEPPPLSRLVPWVPPELDATIASMLAKNADERPQLDSIAEVLELVYARVNVPNSDASLPSVRALRLHGTIAMTGGSPAPGPVPVPEVAPALGSAAVIAPAARAAAGVAEPLPPDAAAPDDDDSEDDEVTRDQSLLVRAALAATAPPPAPRARWPVFWTGLGIGLGIGLGLGLAAVVGLLVHG